MKSFTSRTNLQSHHTTFANKMEKILISLVNILCLICAAVNGFQDTISKLEFSTTFGKNIMLYLRNAKLKFLELFFSDPNVTFWNPFPLRIPSAIREHVQKSIGIIQPNKRFKRQITPGVYSCGHEVIDFFFSLSLVFL